MPTQKLSEIKQKVAEMRQNLERWKSHNEVNAKPADGMLYEFLSDSLSLLERDDDFPEDATPPEEVDQNEPENESTIQSDESGEGKSQINATFDAADDDDTGGTAPPANKERG